MKTLGIRGILVGRDDVTDVGNPGVSGNCFIVETGENIKITVYKSNGSFFVIKGGDTVPEVCVREVEGIKCFDMWCIALGMEYEA